MKTAEELGLGDAQLEAYSGMTICGRDLWKDKAALVIGLRRFGGIFCRNAVKSLSYIKDDLEDIGIGSTCIGFEVLPRESCGFTPAFWPDEIYEDVHQDFFKAVMHANVKKGLAGLLNTLHLRPWSSKAKHHEGEDDTDEVDSSNILACLLLVGQDGHIGYFKVIKNYREFPKHSDIIHAAQELVRHHGRDTVRGPSKDIQRRSSELRKSFDKLRRSLDGGRRQSDDKTVQVSS